MAGGTSCKKICKGFRLFLWDPKKKLICRRTKATWAQSFLFYFGILLLIWVVATLWNVIIIYFIDHYQCPWWELSAIGDSPSLSMHPAGKDHLVMYNMKDIRMLPGSFIEEINNILKAYNNQDKSKMKNCSESCLDSPIPCFFDISSLGPCAKNPYGYNTRNPCILIKLNKVIGWSPCPTDDEYNEDKNIDIVCEGHKPSDREHLSAIQIYPKSGFPIYFFPYSHQENYVSPLVAIQVEEPLDGVIITIKCTSKYKGEKISSLTFQIMVQIHHHR